MMRGPGRRRGAGGGARGRGRAGGGGARGAAACLGRPSCFPRSSPGQDRTRGPATQTRSGTPLVAPFREPRPAPRARVRRQNAGSPPPAPQFDSMATTQTVEAQVVVPGTAAAPPGGKAPAAGRVRADGRFSALRALTAGSKTNENMLLFRTLNRKLEGGPRLCRGGGASVLRRDAAPRRRAVRVALTPSGPLPARPPAQGDGPPQRQRRRPGSPLPREAHAAAQQARARARARRPQRAAEAARAAGAAAACRSPLAAPTRACPAPAQVAGARARRALRAAARAGGPPLRRARRRQLRRRPHEIFRCRGRGGRAGRRRCRL
jgi:hypothetical protein